MSKIKKFEEYNESLSKNIKKFLGFDKEKSKSISPVEYKPKALRTDCHCDYCKGSCNPGDIKCNNCGSPDIMNNSPKKERQGSMKSKGGSTNSPSMTSKRKEFINYKPSDIMDELDSKNESLISPEKSILRKVLGFPIDVLGAVLGTVIANLTNPKNVTKALAIQLLDVYSNLDVIEKILLKESEKNLTSKEESKIKGILNKIKSVKSKYPTIEAYKSGLLKSKGLLVLKDKKYIMRYIEEYKETRMSALEITTLLKSEGVSMRLNQTDVYKLNNNNKL